MHALIVGVIVLMLIPALNTLINLMLLKTPALPSARPSVAILIPARDEEAAIGACVDAALASRGVDLDVIVLDDGSSDATRAVVEARAVQDPRLRIVAAPPLPAGMKGKPHACQVLSTLTDRPFLLFVDADVRLGPEAAARLVPNDGVDLVSGVPRQIVEGLVETAVVPMINGLIYGYLPLWFMRRLRRNQALTAACGQMLMVRASAYRACGGHAAIADRMHDGLHLARRFRRLGYRTDLVAGTPLATCRMYDGAAAVWSGFAKNATEGMARPIALPIWTILLGGGHLLPFIIVPFAERWTAVAAALLILARSLQAFKCGEPWRAVALHPLGVALTLAIQWTAFVRYLRGEQVVWRQRAYTTEL